MIYFSDFEAAGGGGNTPHRYWRIYITANGGDTYASMLELELHEGLYEGNVAPSATMTASSEFDGSNVASNVANGLLHNDAGAWTSNGGSLPQWVKADFGAGNEKDIGAIVIWPRSGGELDRNPTAFDVQWSDDNSSWTTAWSESSVTWPTAYAHQRFEDGRTESYSGSPWGSHRYWRFYILFNQQPALAEIDMASSPGGADILGSSTLTVSSTLGGFPISNARDGNSSTLYSADAGFPHWILADFGGSPVEFGEWIWQARNDASMSFSPTNVVIQFADSSSGPWTTVLQDIPGTPTGGQIFTLTDPLYV